MTITVWNETRQTEVASYVMLADNYFRRLCGLMGKANLPEGHGLWIVPCKEVHSCFMRFEFDVVFVDKNRVVVYLVECMKPWRVSKFVRSAHAVLELPGGVIAQTETKIGDQLVLRGL